MEEFDANDQREYVRLPFHFLTNYRLVRESYYRQGVCITDNLSLSGIMISISEEIKVGSVLEIDISTKDTTISALTKVCHCTRIDSHAFDLGLEFLEISDQALEQLKHILKYD